MKYGFIVLFCASISLPVSADSPVWKISGGGKYLYVAGTVHILSETDYPLPRSFDIAYEDSDLIAIEVDVDRISQPRVRERINERSTYGEGRSLEDDISKSTLLELSRYCVIRNISLRSLVKYKPGAVASILSSIELDRLALTGIGVDYHYLHRARQDKKPVKFLDSVQTDFQLSMDLNDGNPDEVIRYALDNVFSEPEKLRSIKKAWRSGNLKELDRLAVAPLQEKSPFIYRYLLQERNHEWIPKIERMLADDPIELVLFGAADLVGKDGVLPLLAARGYRIENLY